MKNANEVKDQVVEEVNEVEIAVETEAKEEKVFKIFGLEIRKAQKAQKKSEEKTENEETEAEEPKPESKAKKIAKKIGIGAAVVGGIVGGMLLSSALEDLKSEDEIEENKIYELPPMEAEWKPAESDTVESAANAENEGPKEN